MFVFLSLHPLRWQRRRVHWIGCPGLAYAYWQSTHGAGHIPHCASNTTFVVLVYSNLGFLVTRSSISREDFRSPLLSTESGSPLMHWNSATIYPSWLQIYTKPYYDSFIASWQGSFCFVNFCKNSSFAWLTLIPITSYGVQYLIFLRVVYYFCQTPLQLANPTQLQLVWVGVDFVFPRKEEEPLPSF